MSRGSECQQAVSCGRFCISTGWSCTISTPTLSRKQPSMRRFAKDFWGLTPTGIRGPISSPRSLLPRRRGKESLHGGAGRWLHPPVEAGACATVRQYIPAILVSSNKGWQRRWFYLRNDDGRLPSFSQRVVTAVGSNWRYGAPHERQKNLQPLLEALQELRDGGLTAARVVAAIHRRRVLPLTERRLLLSEMASGVDLEGS
jgi:hypothetical protein